MKKVFILGSPDPEMMAIEDYLSNKGVQFLYASVNGKERVRPFEANKAAKVLDPKTMREVLLPVEFVVIECRLEGIKPDMIIDHHNPGDPGFGRPPKEAFEASSIGQLLTMFNDGPDTIVRVNGWTGRAAIVAAADHCLGAAYRN